MGEDLRDKIITLSSGDEKEGSEKMEEAREVEEVRPEEDAPGRARPVRKTEEPLERMSQPGTRSVEPEPPRFVDLCSRGEDNAEEDGE